MIKNYFINESIDEYIEGLNTVDDLNKMVASNPLFIYSRGKSSNIESIRNGGLSREYAGPNGEAYGCGLYTTLSLSSEQSGMDWYGNMIIKHWIPGFNRCLIPEGCISDCIDGDVQQAVYGGMDVNAQIDKFVTDPNDNAEFKHYVRGNDFSFPSHSARMEQLFAQYDIDGILLRGQQWCLWKDFKRVIPYQYSLDNGNTWEAFANQRTLDVSAGSWEPTVSFGTNFDNIVDAINKRPENGYYLVRLKNRDNRYNYMDAKTKEFTSNFFFDFAAPVNSDGFGRVKINNVWYLYSPSEDALYSEDEAEQWRLDAMMPNCYSSDLRDNAHFLDPEEPDIKTESHSLFGNLLNEAMDEFVDMPREDVHYKNPNLYYFYRLAKANQTQSIARSGFSKEFRGYGDDNTDWVGSGTYGNVEPQDHPSQTYGSICWCYATPKENVINHYMCPTPELAAKFGIKETWEEQLKKFFPELWPKWCSTPYGNRTLADFIVKPGYSGSNTIVKFLKACFNGQHGNSDWALLQHDVGGFIYQGNGDGLCVFTLDDSSIIPISYKDISHGTNSEWIPVEITDELWNKTYNGYDPLALLKGHHRDYGEGDRQWITNNYRVHNGYMCVSRKKDKKYNYVIASQGGENFASSVWFDMASPVSDDGLANVVLNGEHFWYSPNDDGLYSQDEAEQWRLDAMMPNYTTAELAEGSAE